MGEWDAEVFHTTGCLSPSSSSIHISYTTYEKYGNGCWSSVIFLKIETIRLLDIKTIYDFQIKIALRKQGDRT